MSPEDLYELRWAGEPRLHPDGLTVAFVETRIDEDANDYRSRILLVPAEGSSEAEPFTSGAKQDTSPRWSPDGSMLAFTSNRERKTKQLYVIARSGGEAVRLTDEDEDVTDPVWSPDGSRIAFSRRVRDEAYEEEDDRRRAPRRFRRLGFRLDNVGWTGDRRSHVFTVAVDGSAGPVQVTHGDYEDSSPAWSPDGARIVFVSRRGDDWDLTPVEDLYAVPSGGGELTRLTHGDGTCSAPSWSPDGTRVAYLYSPGVFDDPRHGRVAVLEVASGTRRVLTQSLDLNCAPFPPIGRPVWDGDEVVFGLEEHGNTHLYRARADGSAPPEPVTKGDVWVTGYDAADGVVVHSATTPTAPSEVFSGATRLTQAGQEFVSDRELVEPEPFIATSEDGAEVEAWVIRPAGFDPGRRYPVLINIHGGPFSQYGNKLFDEFQVYAGAGYAVVYSNPRGSSGYSEAWGRAIRGPANEGPGMGTVDYQDVMAVTEEAVKRFSFCDPDRMGVMGGSYGGFMTSWIVGHTDRFKAACSERAVNDWSSMWGSSDLAGFFKGYVGAPLYENPDAYRQISPTTYATNITTPLLILHSENDLRCNIEQADQLFTTLRMLKREVEMVRFPAESHELSRSGSPVHRVMRFEVLLDFFGRHLQPDVP